MTNLVLTGTNSVRAASPCIFHTFPAGRRACWPMLPDCPSLMSEDLIQRVTKVIATSKRIPLETVTIDREFVQLGIDSMDAVEILFALEGEFDISIPDEEVRSVRNVRDMCAGVERLVAAKSADAPAGQ